MFYLFAKNYIFIIYMIKLFSIVLCLFWFIYISDLHIFMYKKFCLYIIFLEYICSFIKEFTHVKIHLIESHKNIFNKSFKPNRNFNSLF